MPIRPLRQPARLKTTPALASTSSCSTIARSSMSAPSRYLTQARQKIPVPRSPTVSPSAPQQSQQGIRDISAAIPRKIVKRPSNKKFSIGTGIGNWNCRRPIFNIHSIRAQPSDAQTRPLQENRSRLLSTRRTHPKSSACRWGTPRRWKST